MKEDTRDDLTYPAARNDWPILSGAVLALTFAAGIGFALAPVATSVAIMALVGLIAGLAWVEDAAARRRMKG